MRTLALVLLVIGLTACSPDDDDEPARSAGETSTSSGPDTDLRDLSDTETCAEVTAGINAFNVGDLDETIMRFQAAVPLAEELAADDRGAEQLLEAVRYYAELPAEEYLEASESSPNFLRYKQITLTQCAYQIAPLPAPEDTGVPA